MKNTQVARLLAFVTGMVNQQLLLQNEYLVAENRILRAHLPIGFDSLIRNLSGIAWSRSSRRALPTQRFATPFSHGLRMLVALV